MKRDQGRLPVPTNGLVIAVRTGGHATSDQRPADNGSSRRAQRSCANNYCSINSLLVLRQKLAKEASMSSIDRSNQH